MIQADMERHDVKLTLRGLGISQEELAWIAGVHRVTVNRYFRGTLLSSGTAQARISLALRELEKTPRGTLLDEQTRARQLIAISQRVVMGA